MSADAVTGRLLYLAELTAKYERDAHCGLLAAATWEPHDWSDWEA